MLVTLDEMKTYLGISLIDTTYDDFLNEQITLISDTIETYCRRKLLTTSYTQTFYLDDYDEFNKYFSKEISLYHYPIVTLDSVEEDGEALTLSDDVRAHIPSGTLRRIDCNRVSNWFYGVEKIDVTYSAGYDSTPTPIKEVVFSLVGERYNKKQNGIDISFGNDVQRISIPGVMSLDFDYTLQQNERSTHFGMILGNYVNVLDYYRSERAIVGEIRINYVTP